MDDGISTTRSEPVTSTRNNTNNNTKNISEETLQNLSVVPGATNPNYTLGATLSLGGVNLADISGTMNASMNNEMSLSDLPQALTNALSISDMPPAITRSFVGACMGSQRHSSFCEPSFKILPSLDTKRGWASEAETPVDTVSLLGALQLERSMSSNGEGSPSTLQKHSSGAKTDSERHMGVTTREQQRKSREWSLGSSKKSLGSNGTILEKENSKNSKGSGSGGSGRVVKMKAKRKSVVFRVLRSPQGAMHYFLCLQRETACLPFVYFLAVNKL